jgi:DUF4097 and DUF4098 domain-containing protein YvlB
MSLSSDAPSPHNEVRITAGSGSITVIGEPREDVAADGSADVRSGLDGSVEVVSRRPSGALTVRCPEGADVVVGTRSGSLKLRGRLGAVRATTISGGIEADEVLSADLRAMSGSIVVGSCAGTCRVKTKSGSARIGAAGAVEVTIGSGTVTVERVDGAARVRAVSGSVHVGAQGHGRVEVETMSGSITIILPVGCRPDVRARTLSGRPRVDLGTGNDCEVLARTLSGGIVVRSG